MKEYKFHEYANIFPLMNSEKLRELKEDIKKNGLLEGIVLYDDKILDGRNRYNACKELNKDVSLKKLPSTIDPLDYVIATNLQRRQLNGAQIAEVGLKVLEVEERKAKERLKLTQPKKGIKIGSEKHKAVLSESTPLLKQEKKAGKAIRITAKKLGVSDNTLRTAKKVKEMNKPAITKKWEQAKQGKSTIKAVQIAIKKSENKDKPTPKLPIDKYDIIYADPPWEYNFSETPTRALENQYPTMKLKDICALKIPSADNSVLFLWCTSPKLYPEGMEVIKSWGFIYKTSMVWVKDKIGMGYYARNRHEFLLIATKGKPGVPEPSVRRDSVIEAPRAEHSKKPDLYKMIEEMYPNRKYIELFARNEKENWKSWGNEV